MSSRDDVIIVGGGIGGLTLALALDRAGIGARVFEAAPEIRPLGVGINILPQAAAILCDLGLEAALSEKAILTAEAAFFNRFGQFIYKEPLGRAAGNAAPQFSIHRADLHDVLLGAARARLGSDRIHLGWRCTRVAQNRSAATVSFCDARTGDLLPDQDGAVVIGCDGLHSAIRKQLHPEEGEPIYSGVNMWRGVTSWPPILSGATLVRAGWFTPGKMVIYPIRNLADGRQLVNWLAEVARLRGPQAASAFAEATADAPKPWRRRSAGHAGAPTPRDWNRCGDVNDFIHIFEDWRFDWLDVPAFLRAADVILEFPMVDQEPLPLWTVGRVTLLGDAAHPMYPRGSNGAGQAILDAHALAEALAAERDGAMALQQYESVRLPATAAVVRMSRTNPPDAILREVYERTGDKPFDRIEDVISRNEMMDLLNAYRRVTAGQTT